MLDADGCCQRSGVAMPTPPPSGYNAWDTLPSPRTPKTPRSPLTLTLTSPTDSCLTPGEEGLSTVRPGAGPHPGCPDRAGRTSHGLVIVIM